MGWTAGSDVSTGDLITAAQWNNYMGASGSLEYLKGVATEFASGSYAGNSSVNRTIAHGLGITPKLVIIQDYSQGIHFLILTDKISYIANDVSGVLSVTTPSGTNFYVGNATSYGGSANLTGRTYKWAAMG